MEKSIFEGAKFGDKFVTRDGRIARFWHKDPHNYLEGAACYNLILENEYVELICTSNGLNFGSKGNWEEDIVSRYQEPIDEEKLDKLAEETFAPFIGNRDTIPVEVASMMIGFKIGCRKMLEE